METNDLVQLIGKENAEEDKYVALENDLEKEHKDNTDLYKNIENKRNSLVINSKSSVYIDQLFQTVPKSKIKQLVKISADANHYSKHLYKDFKLISQVLPKCIQVESATLGITPNDISKSAPSEILNFLNLLVGDITNSNSIMML